ncbi:uncharacterized protein LOC116343792 [Contarinia nasturtii]|uniref:uncharacterized protein LOC116343792 n=1 Tax=Contarinia nasturtii TaxID=265458 RepID=UPI0012D449D9|nr:uncharacterized protein LOC116343792 [Contarinia nasturtii]
MARLALTIYISFLFACISAISWGDIDEYLDSNNNNIPIEQDLYRVVEENNDFIKAIPSNQFYFSNSQFLQPRITTISTGSTITYVLGKRVNGDRLVASGSQNEQWSVAQNISQKLTYPRVGIGSIITFVQITIAQSSSLGRGLVSSGGIGQRQISITIDALKTLHFRQNTYVYGF